MNIHSFTVLLMTSDEAVKIAEKYLETYRRLSYSELVLKIGEQEVFEGVSADGENYQIEVEFFYDDEKNKNLRVSALISWNLATSFAPVNTDFIIAPNGNFVGE